MVAEALWPAVRRRVLGLLLLAPEKEWHLREIARQTGLSPSAVQREVLSLVEVGILERRVESRRAYYHANARCPIFPDLHAIILKTVALGGALRAAVAPLADRVRVAFVYGSYASGRETADSDIDLLLVGTLSAREAAAVLGPLGRSLGREFNPAIYPPAEFRKKARAGHHFITEVLKGPKVFLIGDEDALAGLVG